MRLQLSVPSKTFLLGEYLALYGGPVLLLNTLPRFKLIVSANKKNQKLSYQNVQANSPALKYMEKHHDFFRNFSLEFRDPYHAGGGFGASSAEFFLLAALKNYYLQKSLDPLQLIKEYKSVAWQGKGLAPSGADIVAQLCGGLTYFNKNEKIIKKIIWPFSQLAFGLIRTNIKVCTHQHIEQLKQIKIDGLEEIINTAISNLENGEVYNFCEAINRYSTALQKRNLVSGNTIELLEVIRSNKYIIAAKGCGALGADVILIFFDKKFQEDILQWVQSHNLKLVAVSDHAEEGFAINLLNGKRKLSHVITVDEHDYQLGVAEKLFAHQKAILHRAFSIFIFRKKNQSIELLLQQRAPEKYHTGGLWSNTCCSHPVPGESILLNAQQRLYEEMGISTPLYEVGTFRYFAELGNGLTEHEYDHVFVGAYQENYLAPNPEEIGGHEWIKLPHLQKDLVNHPNKYTPWLKQALELITNKKILTKLFDNG